MVAWLAQAACSTIPSTPSSAVPTGTWGGDHITMTVTGAGAHLEFDCAHGDVDMVLVLGRLGQFSATGTFVLEHGGPIRQGEPPDSHPAIYDGLMTANTMTLSARVTGLEETLGPFTLMYGSPGRVVKCL
jgi:hypothetical protein